MRFVTKALTALLICGIPLGAKADTLNFILTGEGNSYAFSLASNPVPHASASGILFTLDDVLVTVNDQAGIYDLAFFHAGVDGGGFEISTTPDDDVLLGLDGTQLYAGTENAPIFSPGTFALGNPATEKPYSLVISAVSPPPIPEPSTLWMWGTGLVSGISVVRRKLTAEASRLDP